MQDLDQFYSTATQRGFSRDYQARVSHLRINGSELKDEDLVYIKTISTPSKNAAISTVRYFGAEVHSTGTRDFGQSKQWELTFLSDQNMFLKSWFDARLEEVADNTKNRKQFNPVPTESGYATIDIVDDSLDTVMTYKLNGLFVVSTPGMSYDLAGTGKVQEFKVTLGYQNWEISYQNSQLAGYINTNADTTGQGFLGQLLSGLQTIRNVASTVRNTANAIRTTTNSVKGAVNSVRTLPTAFRK